MNSTVTYSRKSCSEVSTTNINYDHILHKLCCLYVKNPCVTVRSFFTATFSSVIHHELCWYQTSDTPAVLLFLIQRICVAGAAFIRKPTTLSVFPSLVLIWTSTTEQNRAAPIWWISFKAAQMDFDSSSGCSSSTTTLCHWGHLEPEWRCSERGLVQHPLSWLLKPGLQHKHHTELIVTVRPSLCSPELDYPREHVC